MINIDYYVYRLARAEEQLHSVDQTVQINHGIVVDTVDMFVGETVIRSQIYIVNEI